MSKRNPLSILRSTRGRHEVPAHPSDDRDLIAVFNEARTEADRRRAVNLAARRR